MSKPDWCPQEVWEQACSGLAEQYEVVGRQGPYPTYAGLARRGEGDFTLCSILAIARAILEAEKRGEERAADSLATLESALQFYEVLGQRLRTSYGHGEAKLSMLNDCGNVARAALRAAAIRQRGISP